MLDIDFGQDVKWVSFQDSYPESKLEQYALMYGKIELVSLTKLETIDDNNLWKIERLGKKHVTTQKFKVSTPIDTIKSIVLINTITMYTLILNKMEEYSKVC